LKIVSPPGVVVLVAALGACAPAVAPAVPRLPVESAADAARIADELRRQTVPASPRQGAFGWELDEAGARFQGRGVARYVAPDRFRIDLFGPRGETYLAAALIGDEPRVPPAVEARFALPSPALLWAAVGVVRPPSGAVLVEGSESGGVVTLRYRQPDGDLLEFRARGGELDSLRRTRGRTVVETVELTRSGGELARAVYRDWPAYRSLTLTVESHVDVAPFPEATWTPPGT
jgi:hypothetical protein